MTQERSLVTFALVVFGNLRSDECFVWPGCTTCASRGAVKAASRRSRHNDRVRGHQ
jgi:hypothetical protein